MSLMTFTQERARAMIQSTVMISETAARITLSNRLARGMQRRFDCRTLACLEIADLVDEPLQFHNGVAALLWRDLLIDG